tara:strand:- start:24 stop:464 length:441 start_codon:yes stop_codon:yes gene_type:complete
MNNDFWDNFDELPQELVDIIWDFVDTTTKMFVCKSYYLHYHYRVPFLLNINFSCYLRNIVKFDCFFILSLVLDEQQYQLSKPLHSKIKYKNMRYNNYLDYIKALIYEHNNNKSNNCKNVFLTWVNNNKIICKNSFKKKRRDNRWTN